MSQSILGTCLTSMLLVEQLHSSVRINGSVPFKLYQCFIASSPSLEKSEGVLSMYCNVFAHVWLPRFFWRTWKLPWSVLHYTDVYFWLSANSSELKDACHDLYTVAMQALRSLLAKIIQPFQANTVACERCNFFSSSPDCLRRRCKLSLSEASCTILLLSANQWKLHAYKYIKCQSTMEKSYDLHTIYSY